MIFVVFRYSKQRTEFVLNDKKVIQFSGLCTKLIFHVSAKYNTVKKHGEMLVISEADS